MGYVKTQRLWVYRMIGLGLFTPFDAKGGRVLQSSACTDNNTHILLKEAPSS